MSTVRQLRPLDISEYLQLEETSEQRHEYINGELYAMVGATALHNIISGGLFSRLRSSLENSPCHVFMSDMKVRVEDSFYYPDVAVTCEKFSANTRFLEHPVLLIEILSDSTEGRDRFEKRLAYQKIPSLKEYMLVSQQKLNVEIYRRKSEGWELEELQSEDIISLESLGLKIQVGDIYRDAMIFVSE